MLSLVYEDGGEADKPSFTHHAEEAEDNMEKTKHSQHKWQEKWRFYKNAWLLLVWGACL